MEKLNSKEYDGVVLYELENGWNFCIHQGIVFFGSSMSEACLAVCTPYDEQAPTSGNGVMVAFHGGSKEGVDALYAKAISLGATCDGEPGQRIPDVFYGAYVRDAEGNKLCFCHFG